MKFMPFLLLSTSFLMTVLLEKLLSDIISDLKLDRIQTRQTNNGAVMVFMAQIGRHQYTHF
jgi:hypothetical protein